MKRTKCIRFAKCNAPICPLDKGFENSVHLKGEPVCLYLREYSKPHARDNLRGSISKEHYQAIEDAYPIVIERYSPIKKVLTEAADRPSKLINSNGGE